MGTPSLLNWIMDLLRNDHAREAFQANPQAAMASAGLTASCGDDVKDATPFIVDHPDVKWTGHKDFKHNDGDDDDAVTHIKHIVNNYYVTHNHFDVKDNFHPLGHPGDDGIEIDDSTVTDSLNHTSTSDDDGNASSGGVVVDQHGSSVGEDQAGRDANDTDNSNVALQFGNENVGRDDESVDVSGAGSAGHDITTTTGDDSIQAGGDVDDQSGAGLALDHIVETGDIHVISDLVNVDDSLNGSLNDLSALNDFDHLLDINSPLV